MSIAWELRPAALDQTERDPALRERVRGVPVASAPVDTPAPPAFMTITSYADRVSLRMIRQFIACGLPCVETGRARRIARADEWLRCQRQHVDAVVELDARSRARRAAVRVTGGTPPK